MLTDLAHMSDDRFRLLTRRVTTLALVVCVPLVLAAVCLLVALAVCVGVLVVLL